MSRTIRNVPGRYRKPDTENDEYSHHWNNHLKRVERGQADSVSNIYDGPNGWKDPYSGRTRRAHKRSMKRYNRRKAKEAIREEV